MYSSYLIIDEIRRIFNELISRFLGFIPGFIQALILLIIGYIIGKIIGASIRIFLAKVLGLDRWLEMKGLEDAAFGIKVSAFISGLVKWYIYFLFIGAAISTLNIPMLEPYMYSFIEFYPRIIAAAVIILFGLIVGEWFRERILETDVVFKEHIGVILKFIATVIFFVIALNSLMIDATPILWILAIFIGGIIIAISVAVGVALGFALKDEIKPYIQDFIKQLVERKEKKEENAE